MIQWFLKLSSQKSYFNWYLQSYTNLSVYSCPCNVEARMQSGQAKEFV